MSQSNAIAVSIPEADLQEIRQAIGVLRAKLVPHLRSLTPQDRHELPKMGDKTMSFVTKAYEYGMRHAEFVPAFLDFSALATDMQAVELLRELSMGLEPLSEALSDSLTLSGSEAYQGALLFYGNVKAAAKAKEQGAEVIYEDLSARFPGGRRRKKPRRRAGAARGEAAASLSDGPSPGEDPRASLAEPAPTLREAASGLGESTPGLRESTSGLRESTPGLGESILNLRDPRAFAEDSPTALRERRESEAARTPTLREP